MTKVKRRIMSATMAVCLLFSGCETTGVTSKDPTTEMAGDSAQNTDNANQITNSGNQSESDKTASTDESGQPIESVNEEPKNTLFREGLLAVKTESGWGYIDESGAYVIEPQFYIAYNFMPNGLAIAGDGSGLGLIDKNGNYILEPIYYNIIEEFDSNGIAKVACNSRIVGNERVFDWGLINENGECILEPQFSRIYQFSNGWAVVQRGGGGLYNYVNAEGKLMFEEMRAITGAKNFNKNGWAKINEYYTSNYIDTDGNYIFEYNYHDLGNFASNGLAYAKKDFDSKFGYIDENENYVIPPKFDKAKDFDSSGFAAVNIGFEPNYDPMTDMQPLSLGKWGFIDEQGNFVIEPKYDEIAKVRNGRAIVKMNEKYGYINLEENIMIEPIYDNLIFLDYDGAAGFILNNRVGLIDKHGNIAIEAQYLSIGEFKNGIAMYTSLDYKMGYISETGEILTEPVFSNLKYFDENGYAQAANENGWGVIDNQYNFVIQPQSWAIGDFAVNGLARVRYFPEGTSYIGEMNGTNLGKTPFGYINRNGETVIDIKYYNATDFYDDGYAVIATASETYHIINSNGEYLTEQVFGDVQQKQFYNIYHDDDYFWDDGYYHVS